MRQFGYIQTPPVPAKVIPVSRHCITLRGVQLYDWNMLLADWIQEWAVRRNTSLRTLQPLPTWDFLPSVEYRDWFLELFGRWLRLSDGVPQNPLEQPPHPPQDPPQP
ncbi:hypothetical protein PIB30_114972, partial [Stylosanthes scabra]|nr:hypothetical protein [Stylosanthes scabra]